MNKYFLVLLSVSLLLLVLCLKISLVEYFTINENQISKIQNKYGINNNIMTEVKQKCSDELNKVLNDKSMKQIVNGLINDEVTSIMSLATTIKPKSIENLTKCINKNNIHLTFM